MIAPTRWSTLASRWLSGRPARARSARSESDRRGRRSAIGLQLQNGLLTAAQCEHTANGPRLLALAEAEVPLDAPDDVIGERLRTLIDAHPYQGVRTVCLLGVNDLFTQSIRVPRASGDDLEAMVRAEAADRLPVNPNECEIRFLPAAEVRHDEGVRQEVLLFACRRTLINRQLSVLETAGLEPVAIDFEPAASLRALRQAAPEEALPGLSAGTRPEDGASNGSLTELPHRGIINLTRDSFSLSFVEGGRILFVKHLSAGGLGLDRAIADAMDVPLAEATRLRTSIANCRQLDPTDDVHRAFADAIARPIGAMIRELELCLRYHKVTFRRPLASLELIGSDAAGWLSEAIGSQLERPCTLGRLGLADAAVQPSETHLSLNRACRWIAPVGAALRPRSGGGIIEAGNATPAVSATEVV